MKIIKPFTLTLVAVIFFSQINVKFATAAAINYGIEGVYKGAQEKFVIDGISSEYTLGTIGLFFKAKFKEKFEFGSSFGIGYLENYQIFRSGTSFRGPVQGNSKSVGWSYDFLNKGTHSMRSEVQFASGKVSGNKFKGTRSGNFLEVSMWSELDTTDYSLKYINKNLNQRDIGVSLGLSRWEIRGQGVLFIDDATLSKSFSKSGSSPVFSIFAVFGGDFPFELSFTKRSFSLDSNVDTFEFSSRFYFSN
jgi:hypothetical protein